jgi:lysyl-tRNA synthetase class 1
MSNLHEEALKSKAWPFDEARKVLKRLKGQLPEKGYVLFETGYGPSGLPHIGTFGEVARTAMIQHAFEVISGMPTKLVSFSDDLDGMRKVPGNVPNQDMMQDFLQKPLTDVPDPFGTHDSFGAHNNAMLCRFLDTFGFEYDFYSSTEYYRSGAFDEVLLRAVEKYDEIMEVMLASLREERQKSYSIFLPISPKTGRVLYVPMKSVSKKSGTITFDDEDGTETTLSVTGGNVKLQWKPDFGARWSALNVDFEMYGKDHSTNTHIYDKICRILGAPAPSHFFYELFLDENGEKISKSKGNGISIEDWLKYASPESLALYMFQNPQRAKKLYPQVIPKAVDEYLSFLEKFETQPIKEQLGNPVWHVHNGVPPKEKNIINFGVLLNLVSASNADNEEVLWKFIQNFAPDTDRSKYPILNQLVKNAISYFNDHVKIHKKYRNANEQEKKALLELNEEIKKMPEGMTPEEMQTVVFTVGKKYYPKEELRNWFKAIYEVVFGDEQGPRMGSFICFFGKQETIDLINKSLSRN